eukprot:CAMPEP_0170516654 /NCGR_PEP_ID=MMETSP0209-20121228/2813_1 /TAXON_ID=665100 ORGANISM="Litonotus pictus, Strain P1" /NCGR_SAMPLE_ID=MMETSP0209 /ASSEMBLY_ACC=CAM_ASM_000301 /LENGTH=271 /DNA_ID=CAMNT_0010801613 /DNA_START=583 /DNA_END=1395 /DNA_ORIENTATION=+
MLIKIHHLEDHGSLKDLLSKVSNPLEEYSKKYNSKKSGLHLTLIALYGRQILEALNHFHSNRVFFMNLHSGNVLVNTNTNKVKLLDFESFYFDLPIKYEQHYFYLIELFLEEYQKQNFDKQSAMLSDIFSPKFNVFEVIDMVSFGRVIYEMYTGKELKAPYPDELEYPEMEDSIKGVLKSIFPVKVKTSYNSKTKFVGYPEVSAADLLKTKFFAEATSCEFGFEEDRKQKKREEKFADKISVDSEDLRFEVDGLSHIKEEIFNQKRFIGMQ